MGSTPGKGIREHQIVGLVSYVLGVYDEVEGRGVEDARENLIYRLKELSRYALNPKKSPNPENVYLIQSQLQIVEKYRASDGQHAWSVTIQITPKMRVIKVVYGVPIARSSRSQELSQRSSSSSRPPPLPPLSSHHSSRASTPQHSSRSSFIQQPSSSQSPSRTSLQRPAPTPRSTSGMPPMRPQPQMQPQMQMQPQHQQTRGQPRSLPGETYGNRLTMMTDEVSTPYDNFEGIGGIGEDGDQPLLTEIDLKTY